MLKFNQLLQEIVKGSGLTMKINPDNRGLEVIFPNNRRQKITIERQGDRYLLTSIVLGRQQVEGLGQSEVLTRLWERNREINVIAFSLDKRGRLVGSVEQLAETVDSEELAFYLTLLARECDQFEYALTGRDWQ